MNYVDRDCYGIYSTPTSTMDHTDPNHEQVPGA